MKLLFMGVSNKLPFELSFIFIQRYKVSRKKSNFCSLLLRFDKPVLIRKILAGWML